MATLDELYTQIINEQRNYLAQIQENFNKQCDQITVEAEKKLESIPFLNTAERQKILQEQKQQFDQALANFKNEINVSSAKVRKRLEEINSQREAQKIAEIEEKIKKL